jgi:purine-binding chemotaxis protein CheW
MSHSEKEVPHQVVVFRVAETRYAIDIAGVDEILAVPPITPIAGAPNGVVGLVNIRGRIAPVFDLRWKFGVATNSEAQGCRLVLVETGAGPVALHVDSVEEVRTVGQGEIQPVRTPGASDGLGYLRGVLRRADELVLWVDHLTLVPDSAVRSLRLVA